eukprot:scaffold43901_cov52-Attheya_sp.AAC.3
MEKEGTKMEASDDRKVEKQLVVEAEKQPQDENEDDDSDIAVADNLSWMEDHEESEENVAPLHLHTLRGRSVRLGAAATHSRSSSRSSRSRSSSPPNSANNNNTKQHSANASTVTTTGSMSSLDVVVASTDHGSVCSSLDDVDPDILLDRLGLEDYGLAAAQGGGGSLSSSQPGLPPVSERMSSDEIDDSHAFTDLVVVFGASSSSVAGEASLLETFYEEDDDEEDDIHKYTGTSSAAPNKSRMLSSTMEVLFELAHHDDDTESINTQQKQDLSKLKIKKANAKEDPTPPQS